jgi:hypothetical protein
VARPYEIEVEDERGRAADSERRRLRRFWLHVVALAVHDQDADWIGGSVSGRNLILEAAGIEPGYWDRVMRPLADAMLTERKLAKLERRQPRPILPDAIDRSCLRHSGFGTHSV